MRSHFDRMFSTCSHLYSQSIRTLTVCIILVISTMLMVSGASANFYVGSVTGSVNGLSDGFSETSTSDLTRSASGDGAEASASAGGAVGYLRVNASGAVIDNPDSRVGDARATADAQFGDTFVIDGGSLNGTEGTATFVVGITGGGLNASASEDIAINPFPSASASFTSMVTVTSTIDELFLERFGSKDDSRGSPPSSDGSTTGMFTGTYSFIFGTSIDLNVQAIASIFVQGEGEASARFANTVAWGGLTEVLDASGNLVTDFTANGASGLNWALPAEVPSQVPIPPALWLFGSGLLGLIGMARRKKASN